MSEATFTFGPDGDEAFLARFILALEVERDLSQVVGRFCALRPDLTFELHDLAGLTHRLDEASNAERLPAMPERLGEFRLVRLIAAGGMGEIYEAEQESLERRRVAIKVIRRGQASAIARSRFCREQTVLSALHHTHLIPLLTAGQHDGIQYFAMPYIQGATLSRLLDGYYQRRAERGATPTFGEMAATLGGSRLPPGGDRRSLGEAPVRLSLAYYRSVAEVMALAAEALEHAHQAGFVHRDLKPSNLMVDGNGHCWIIDFGLAGTMPASADGREESDGQGAGKEAEADCGLLGTIPYLAPEQLDGRADVRSDVYGLGATLYELCTWRPPFAPVDRQTVQRIRSDSIRPPRELAAGLPADLAAICQKTLAKSPEQRYQAAADFAADLRRWLGHEPIAARPAYVSRRVWLWARRNPGWAAFMAAVYLALMLGIYQVLAANFHQAGLLAEAGARERLGQLERQRAAPKQAGWSDIFEQQARELASINASVELRSLAATGLAGPDARRQREFPQPASSVAFDAQGQHLLIGGTGDMPARLWDGSEQPPTESQQIGPGPVAFAADGTPLQLFVSAERELILWNVAANELVREFKFPDDEMQIAALELSTDGSIIGACGLSIDKKRGLIVIWNRASGEIALRLDRVASTIAFSPDGTLVAAGDSSGRSDVWSIADRNVIAAELSADRAGIMALAFGRDPRTSGQAQKRWLLAAGDNSGNTTIWDLAKKAPRTYCRGSAHHIHSLEFSPDGVTLGSVGRGDIKLWDTTTGRLVLSIHERNWLTDLAFSPDGLSIAVSSDAAFDDPGQASVWKLELSRGIQTLRGLNQPIATAIFSPGERYVAAIAHDSRVGVWDRQAERLLHIFEAPVFAWVDNAALMFSPDGKQLACSGPGTDGNSHATLWDVASGEVVAQWTLPAGLNHFFAFSAPDEPLLFQVERPERGRAVGRLYDLVPGKEPSKRGFEITEFRWAIEFPMLPEDGRLIFVKGTYGQERPEGRKVVAYDARTGKELWMQDLGAQGLERNDRGLMLDRSGKFLAHESEGIIELPSGKFLGKPPAGATDGHRWSPEMPYYIDNRNLHLALVPRGQTERVLDLDRDSKGCCVRKQLSAGGDLFVWGTLDGAVHICDIAEVRRRLTEIGLGW